VDRTRPARKPVATPPRLVAIACWFDLLGYGEMMDEAGFDPTHPGAQTPLKRLRAFHRIVREHSSQNFPTLVMNDGAVAHAPVSPTSGEKVWTFIQRSWELYRAATVVDQGNGGPGLRAVIAVGLRAKGSREGIDAQEASFAGLLERVAEQQITLDRAKTLARSIRRSFDIVPTLQANFAFARAYLAESSGTKGGFPGPNIFLDTKVFRGGIPTWVDADPPFEWIPKRASLATRFVALRGFNDAKFELDDFRTGDELYPELRFHAT